MQKQKELKQLGQTTPTRYEKKLLKAKMLEIKRQIWVAKGVRKHSLDTDKLNFVIEKFRRIGKVPKGYLFPELIQSKEASEDMQAMEQRMKLHYQ